MTETNLKNINFMSQDQYDALAEKNENELYAVDMSDTLIPFTPKIGTRHDLVLGANGAKYTAQADGYVNVAFSSSAAGQTMSLYTGVNISIYSTGTNSWMSLNAPVKKGEEFSLNYSSGMTNLLFAFIYTK